MTESEKPDASAVREGQRIAKVMARAGLCSRRDAEAWILEGRVSVNGEVLASPAYNVSEADDVRVDGARLGAPERTRLFMLHKPRGQVTTARDPEGRQTIFGALPPDLPRLVAIGRLDINTEGLLLLTNDGGLARVLELPATGWLRRYRVRAHGEIEQSALDALREGVTIEGVRYAGIEAKLDREQGSNVWITMGLREGKNREIKRVLDHLGLAVNRLIRVSFGPFELRDLPDGAVEEVPTRVLRDQLGAKLAREAGVNFDAAVVDRSLPAPEAPAKPRAGERRPRPMGGDRSLRGRDRAAPPARRAPVEPSTPQRKRKHVSAIRAEEAVAALGPRKRIERSATQDRKGRAVEVERLTPTREEMKRRADESAGKAARLARYAARRESAPAGRDSRHAGGKKPYAAKTFAAKPFGDKRGPGKFDSARAGAERGRDEGRSEAAPRRAGRPFGGERFAGKAAGERPFRRSPRDEGAGGRERPPREAAPYRERPPREGAPQRARPPREAAPYRERPPRQGAPKHERPPREGAPYRGRPPREGAPYRDRPPREGASSRERPRGDKKPFGDRSGPRARRDDAPPRREGPAGPRKGPPRGPRSDAPSGGAKGRAGGGPRSAPRGGGPRGGKGGPPRGKGGPRPPRA